MTNWKILHRIIKGDLRPYLVNSPMEIAVVEELMNTKKPEDILGELIDLTFPPPIDKKSEIYYWLIKYETRAIKDDLKNLLVEITEEEQLHLKLNRHFAYGINLMEEAKMLRKRINEEPEAKMIDENCYILGCCESHISLIINDLLDFYKPIIPENTIKQFFFKLNSEVLTRISSANFQLNNFLRKKKENKVSLFSLDMPKEKQDEFIAKLYLYLRQTKRIDTTFSQFERHFLSTRKDFKKTTWIGAVPQLKFIFNHLIVRGGIIEPKENLDHLIHLHFLNKKHEPINENYLSQSLSRLNGSEKASKIEKELDLIISNFKSH